jgi:hypothetical protein
MIRTEKFVRVKKQLGRAGSSGGPIVSVREHYLREDVPCRSHLCPHTCPDWQPPPCLPLDVTHYVIPDCSIGKDFLEVMELPLFQNQGLLFFQTVTNHVQFEGGRRQYNRLKSLLRDKSRCHGLFLNEFNKHTYLERDKGETLTDWQSRILYHGVMWYHEHLKQQVPLIVLSEDERFLQEYSFKTIGIFVMKLEDYFRDFWPDEKEALDLCASLATSVAESKNKSQTFRGHLPEQVLNSGLKSGRYIQGILQVIL